MAIAPDSLAADLLEHVHFWLSQIPVSQRRRSRWVMTVDWLNECRKLAIELGYVPALSIDGPDYLFGIEIEVRDHGGPPHLEVT